MNTDNPLVTEAGRPGRLVVRPDDVEVAERAYAAGGMQAALESYARRVVLGLAVGAEAAR